MKDSSSKTIEIAVTKDHLYEYEFPNKPVKKNFFVVSLDVSRTWIPKEWSINNDIRELGVAVLIPEL